MSQNKILNFAPIALTNAAANYLNPPAASGGVGCGASGMYCIVRQADFVNKTASPHTFSAFKGLTAGSAAGTEILGSATSVAANTTYTWRGFIRFDTADFLSALADANTAITLMLGVEIGVAG